MKEDNKDCGNPLITFFTAFFCTVIILIISGDVHAKDVLKGKGLITEVNIRLSGNITAIGCTVDPVDVKKTIQLGDIMTNNLHSPSGHSDPVAFSIHLTGCTGNGVSLSFTGVKDATDNTLLALNKESTAAGVAVEIMDSTHSRINMGDNSQVVKVDNNGNAVLNFSARYYTVGTPSGGSADADSEFVLTYD